MTGVTLSDEDKGLVPIIRNRTEGKGSIIFVEPYEQLPADLEMPQNYPIMASSRQSRFDQYAFRLDVDV